MVIGTLREGCVSNFERKPVYDGRLSTFNIVLTYVKKPVEINN